MAVRVEKPLIVITGPTASGKTSAAINLAKKYNGEIICADSRTIYRGMDIGTAKPTSEDQTLVPHHGLDLVEPGERFTVADFKEFADKKIADIRARGKVPFLVGGTGLYVDAIIYRYNFSNDTDRTVILENTIAVSIATNRGVLYTRIADRAEQILQQGVVEEAIMLGKKYGWNNAAMTGNIYPLIKKHLDGELSKYELIEKFATSDRRLAKRQMTWFRRNPYLLWCTLTDAEVHINKLLASYKNVLQ